VDGRKLGSWEDAEQPAELGSETATHFHMFQEMLDCFQGEDAPQSDL
jgi:hypothetical protein